MITSSAAGGKPRAAAARFDPDPSTAVHTRRLDSLRRLLARHGPWVASPGGGVERASVALLVRPSASDLELLVIKRAVVAGDPWSGHMAFPGGRRDARDADELQTALRETREEVGIDLAAAGQTLGRLDDVQPREGAPRIVVSPFVFGVGPRCRARPNYEAELALWVPVTRLGDPGSVIEYIHALSTGEQLRFPAIAYQEHVIWGLTHRIMQQFLEFVRAAGGQGE